MAKSFTLEQLTEGIRQRHMGSQNVALVEKWSRTGLLRGMDGYSRENMALMLENQAAQLLREANSLGTGAGGGTASGDLRGFTNIAFPIVRRVFGGLIANELVSIQPMSLPSGLLFYLDYTYGSNVGGDASLTTGDAGANNQETYSRGQSIYNNPTGKGVRSGSLATGGQYDLAGATYSKVHSSSLLAGSEVLFSGAFAGNTRLQDGINCQATGSDAKLLQFDPQVLTLIEEDPHHKSTGRFQFVVIDLTTGATDGADLSNAKDISLFTADSEASLGIKDLGEDFQGGTGILNLRRLNQVGTFDTGTKTFTKIQKYPVLIPYTHLLQSSIEITFILVFMRQTLLTIPVCKFLVKTIV